MLSVAHAIFAIAIRKRGAPVIPAPLVLSFTPIATNLER